MGLKLQVRQNARYERNIEATITFINGSASFNSFKFCLIDFLKFIIVGYNVQKNAHFFSAKHPMEKLAPWRST